ncbi:pyridoxamine 5'-phosphate oxidase family protein [Dubosiella newyorkensis]|uniref:pyridoxamine 5'-phosphate oxidase family protein n=1 Tax=Dubosiella newyorkensis TaxID=1862672 RepID=UPI003F681952
MRPELFSTDYASVIAHGKIELVEKEDEKKELALMALLERCAPNDSWKEVRMIDRAV